MEIKNIILLSSNENTRQVEEEWKNQFIHMTLTTLGIPFDSIWPDETQTLNTNSKIQLANLLKSYDVQVIDDLCGGIKIYCEEDLVAEWKKPFYKLKRDLHAKDPRKQLYMEMLINAWTIFEDETENE